MKFVFCLKFKMWIAISPGSDQSIFLSIHFSYIKSDLWTPNFTSLKCCSCFLMHRKITIFCLRYHMGILNLLLQGSPTLYHHICVAEEEYIPLKYQGDFLQLDCVTVLHKIKNTFLFYFKRSLNFGRTCTALIILPHQRG